MGRRPAQAPLTLLIAFMVASSAHHAQTGDTQDRGQPLKGIGVAPIRLPDDPLVLDTAEQHKIRVVVVAKGFAHPSSFAFLPDGRILVTERAGRLRIVRGHGIDPEPIAGVPEVRMAPPSFELWGLMNIVPHPRFAINNLLYFTYMKPLDEERATITLARGRLEGHALMEVQELLVAAPPVVGVSPIAFGRDGMLYMGLMDAATNGRAQDPADLAGKVLRLRDDGTVPSDNPFVGRPGHRPEIYSLGHRSPSGLAVHPETGALWESEHGPQGGDEVNVLVAGRNYGWPLVSYGRHYDGARVSEIPWRDGMDPPAVFWVPSIAPSGLAFYTGDRFPAWKGTLFVSGMQRARMPRTGSLERIVLNSRGEEIRRESLLTELKKRIRDVRQGPDGLVYVVLEDHVDGKTGGETALARIEPVP